VRLGVRNGWLATAALAGFVLVALAARAGAARPGSATAARPSGRPREVRPNVSPWPGPPGPHKPVQRHFQLPWSFIGLLLAAILLLAVIGIAVALWPQWRGLLRSRRRRLPPRRPIEPAPDDVIRQVSSTLRSATSQMAGGQVRDAVILCWHRLEQTADAAGLRRSPADTSSDLAGRLLASMPLSEAPLNRLAALYREARFSSHPIPAEAVAQARADLVQLRSELEAAVGLAAGAGHG
jgi:hypothetical protein